MACFPKYDGAHPYGYTSLVLNGIPRNKGVRAGEETRSVYQRKGNFPSTTPSLVQLDNGEGDGEDGNMMAIGPAGVHLYGQCLERLDLVPGRDSRVGTLENARELSSR